MSLTAFLFWKSFLIHLVGDINKYDFLNMLLKQNVSTFGRAA